MANIDLHDASTVDLTPAVLHERGQTAMERGDLTAARAIYAALCAQTNTDLTAWKILAELEHRLGNSAGAHAILVNRVTLLELHRTGGVDPSTESLLRRYKAATPEESGEPADSDPKQLHTSVINGLIQKAKQNEDWDTAVSLERILISRYPENLRFAYFLAVFLREQGGQDSLREALSILRGLRINGDPQYAISVENKITEIEVALAIGEGDLTTFSDEFFLNNGPSFIVNFAKRARNAQDWPTVVRMQRLLVQISPDRVQSWMLLAAALRNTGEKAGALEAEKIYKARRALKRAGDRGSIQDFLR